MGAAKKSITMDIKETPKILVIYTGGTIGMTKENGVYMPKKRHLPDFMKKTPTVYGEPADDIQRLSTFKLEKQEDKNILYSILEWDDIKDSSNFDASDWRHMVRDIQRFYTVFDGFVILHGTDTMVYTASALSFMLDNLTKPVVITGSQIPLSEFRSDGENNILGSLAMASHSNLEDGSVIAEVCIFFGGKLIRGNRSMKFSCTRLDAFDTPNFPPLATMDTNIQASVNWSNVRKPIRTQRLNVKANMSGQVDLLWIHPNITVDMVKTHLQADIKGVVLMTYGAGNVPSDRQDILDEIKAAVKGGKLIVNCTQCPNGQVAASYETGQVLIQAGVIPLSDITPEAALAKLDYVIENVANAADRKAWLSRDLRGEMTV